MARDELPQLVQDLLYAEQFRLLDDDVGIAVTNVVKAGVTDDFVRDLIVERVRRHKIDQAFAGPFPLPKLSVGDISPGVDVRGNLIRFPLQYLNGHTFTLGGSGSGKTTRSRVLVLQIASRVQGMWLIDLRKREYAPLAPLLQRLGVELIVLPARKLRLNPLQVPRHVDPADWAPRLSDMLVAVLNLPTRAAKLLHTTILELYRDFGVLDGGQRYPTLFDLRERVAANRQANVPARQAVVDSIDPVLMSLGPEVLAYRYGWTTDELARRHIVFELGGVAEVDKDLILNTLLLTEFTSRVAQGVSNTQMDLWICLDEAQRLVSATDHRHGILELIGLVRGTGIGLDLSVQSSSVADGILSNTANKFIGRCTSLKDLDVGSALGLTTEQRRWLSLNLVPGLFVAQLGEGWRHPFLVRVPPLRLPRPREADPAQPLQMAARLPMLPTDPI